MSLRQHKRRDGKSNQYKVGKKKVYMTASAAKEKGYERVSKYPKSTKYGRQNPIAERWNSEEQLVLWRAAWADVTNRHLETAGHEERIDHRSHADRGLTEQPTIHEGVVARALEKKGIVSDRCELNRQIKADNALLRELKATVKKLMQAVKASVPALAEAMESLRANMVISRYQICYAGFGKHKLSESLNVLKPDLERYALLVQQIKNKTKERKTLLAEKKATPFYQFVAHNDLAKQIAELTEDLEELRSEKTMLLSSFDCSEDTGIAEVKKSVAAMEKNLIRLSCLTASVMFLNYWGKKQRYNLFVSICRKNRSRQQSVKKLQRNTSRNGKIPFPSADFYRRSFNKFMHLTFCWRFALP